MNTPDQLLLLAPKYLWWKTADEVLAHPELLIAQIMNLGTWDDVAALEAALGSDRLREALQHAEAGEFSERSWQFWHLRLHVAELSCVPPLPRRRFE